MPRRTGKMPQHLRSELSVEEEAKLNLYREKWLAIQVATDPLDIGAAIAAIEAAYRESNFEVPEIRHYSNPLIAISTLMDEPSLLTSLGQDIRVKFSKRVLDHTEHLIRKQLSHDLLAELVNKVCFPTPPHYWTEDNPIVPFFPLAEEIFCVDGQLCTDIGEVDSNWWGEASQLRAALHKPAGWSTHLCRFDFCISELKLKHDKKKWKVLQDLAQHCSFIFMFERVCILCDRPNSWSFDPQNRLHAEGKPAIQFPDGYGIYASHGQHPSTLEEE